MESTWQEGTRYVEERFDTRDERNYRYLQLKTMGVRDVIKATNSERPHVRVNGRMVWIIRRPFN